jgi:hypothetical protein
VLGDLVPLRLDATGSSVRGVTAKPTPVWPLPVLALLQVVFGMALVPGVDELDGSWTVGFALVWTIVTVGGCALLVLAVRNCRRLWRVAPGEESWSMVVAVGLAGAFSWLWATGPLSIGVWHWDSLVHGAFGAYLVVVLARELRRRSAGRLATSRGA